MMRGMETTLLLRTMVTMMMRATRLRNKSIEWTSGNQNYLESGDTAVVMCVDAWSGGGQNDACNGDAEPQC